MENQKYSTEQAIIDVMSANRSLYDSLGMTAEYLANKHKQELNAAKPTRLKIKGALTPLLTKSGNTKKGQPKIVAVSGVIEKDADGSVNYGDGETVVEFKDADMAIRQKARMDATKMRGEYPIETKALAGVGDFSQVMQDVIDAVDGSNRGTIPAEDGE